MQRYQDIIERHISKGNQRVLEHAEYKVFHHQWPWWESNSPNESGNWEIAGLSIVSSFVNDDNAEIDSLTTFDPSGDVIINKQFQEYLVILNLVKRFNWLDILSPNKLEYKSNTKGRAAGCVFRKFTMAQIKDGKAYLDGQPVGHIR